VVKIGGSLDDRMRGACADVAELRRRGHRVVVAHGGGAEADRLGAQLGRTTRHLTSRSGVHSRYTDAEALDTLSTAILGRVKPALVAALLAQGVPAIGLSGIDAGVVTAVKTAPARVLVDGAERVVRDDLTGRIAAVDVRLLNLLLDAGYTPVLSPPALDPAAGPLNVDADRLAAAVAGALRADWLIVLSNVPGLLRDPADPDSLIEKVRHSDLADHVAAVGGRMRVKLRTAGEALAAGVARVVLADGRNPSPILAAREGQGTVFESDAVFESDTVFESAAVFDADGVAGRERG
jgi:acetylglutamate/LysW-gamma-L-alpha-aminoadipate kinase